MDTIRLKARAKINLGLDVVRRREDGYHEVKMVMQMLRLYDQIDIEKTQESGILVRSNLSFLPTDERNIAYKAESSSGSRSIYQWLQAWQAAVRTVRLFCMV